ncbi:MAG TPA: hopanoid biosynthesis associated protein HpnK [Chloroflexi bacterium]|nr:hopanoid biosynthesis associated protein HpnK [Chloroflexota bacterium]
MLVCANPVSYCCLSWRVQANSRTKHDPENLNLSMLVCREPDRAQAIPVAPRIAGLGLIGLEMQVILNADDFGRSAAINAAVMQSHREGVLTSASLMVAGDAVEAAVALARETPTLAVGLHVVVVAGRAVLPPNEIPHLVDGRGWFPRDPVRTGLRYFLMNRAKQELARELAAQFDRFAATGLPLSHVDSHLHMHMHPTVFGLLLPLAEQYGACGLRLPRDDIWLSLRCDRRRAATKAAWAVIFGLLSRWCHRRLQGHPLTVAQRVYGLMQSGQMREDYVVTVLRRLNVPSAELYFHPATGPEDGALGPNPGDLATLLSPTVRQVLQERGLRLATYRTLKQA